MKNENCRIVTFDSLKEASWCTDCNAKNQNSFGWTIFEKMRLDRQKSPKKFNYFSSFLWLFFKNDHVYRLFECFYEVSWSTEFNSTETSHVLCTILEKNGKNFKMGQFFWTFWMVKSHFFKNYPSKWVLVFCVAISASTRFFYAIERCHPTSFIFYLCQGVPLLRQFLKKKCPHA